MATSKNLANNANLQRAFAGGLIAILGGTVRNYHTHESASGDQSSEKGEFTVRIRQESTEKADHPSLPQRYPFSAYWASQLTSYVINTRVSHCEEQRRQQVDLSYPDLSRFGPASYLKRYLTPEVYAALKDKKTKNGVTLEDIIKSGVSLPWGAKPPRGTGVYAGDEESYHVFAKLLVPIIEDYHSYNFPDKQRPQNEARRNDTGVSNHKNRIHSTSQFVTAVSPSTVLEDGPIYGRNAQNSGVMLRRSFTNLNRNSVLEQKLDPTGDYILQTRMRVARSIKGFPFSPVISRAQRRELEELFKEMLNEDWNNDVDDDNDYIDDDDDEFGFGKIINTHGGLRGGRYVRVMDMTNQMHNDLINRHILFHDPDEYNISAGIGRDWPDARGIYLNSSANSDRSNQDVSENQPYDRNPDLIIWLNKEDHMRVVATSHGGDLMAVFKRLSKALTQIEQSLHKRGHAFAKHPRYGFVNTSPENLGTALRASVYIKLYRLGKQPGFEELLERLRLESSSRFKANDSNSEDSGSQYTGIFDIANAERLGQSEVQLINTMINGVGRLIELEKRLEQGEELNLEEVR